jgi:hydrogenase nickel incorporation protein HypB
MNIDIFETKERILADNEEAAKRTKEKLTGEGAVLVNLMGSPGAGKTSVLLNLIKLLKDKCAIGVIEADVDSDVDAQTIADTGVKAIQIHTAGLCHMDADMTSRALDRFGTEGLDLIFLENIGNLVCPAEFDVGADLKMMILSVPEGDDKPLKYPLMFTVSDIMLVNKIDTAPIFDFDLAAARDRARALNPAIKVLPVSAKNGEGFTPLADELYALVKKKKGARV